MSVLAERAPNGSETAIAITTTVGLALVGGIAAFAGVLLYGVFTSELLGFGDDLRSVASIGVQLGFAAVALAYLSRVDDPAQYVEFRRPTVEDAVWVLLILIASGVSTVILPEVMGAIGITPPTHEGGGTKAVLLNRPLLWLVAIPALYLFAAPVEEVLYRGVVHGRLRPHLGTGGTVLVGAVAFGLMHAVTGAFLPTNELLYQLATTTVFGAVWGVAYERTKNLLVTSLTHAMFWTVPFSTIFPV